MDFYNICFGRNKNGVMEVYPDWRVGRSKDLMVQGRSIYAIWDEEKGLWSRDAYDVQRLVDQDLYKFADEKNFYVEYKDVKIKELGSYNSRTWSQFKSFVNDLADNMHPLDEKLTFANTPVRKSDYVSRRLPYSLEEGDIDAWDELIGTLYSPEERQKIEWAIGAIVSGDAKKIQKFLVLYGPAGTGKSTVLNIIERLFSGYTATFEAKALGGNNNAFATEAFKSNPLVAIQHDGDLSKIEDNTKLNSIIAHEDMLINEKFKPSYTSRVNAFLFMGTNQPVKISDAKSGIIRRLIDVHPTGKKIPINHYHSLMSQVDFELGAIAYNCLQVYQELGKNFYNAYQPLEMMFQTDIFFNFIEAYYDIFEAQNGASLKQAYSLYKEYCTETGIERPLPQYRVREELRNYFDEFKDRGHIEGREVRSLYYGFNANRFKSESKKDKTFSLVIEETVSLLDRLLEDQPAQYVNPNTGNPKQRWENVKTTLAELDTHELHYVKVPQQHIVIDFDLTDEKGEKSLEKNLEAASIWPPTYAELSKGGAGVHLHYIFDGNVSELAASYSEGIEVKTLLGDASLRRRLSKCNGVPVATLKGGLPLKEKKMLTEQTIKSEKGLRDLIKRNLRKEIHPGTKPSIDFIHKILEDAYNSDLSYDVSDMRNALVIFANNSTHQPMVSMNIVNSMKFKSEDKEPPKTPIDSKDPRLVIFDVEVFPNLFVLCWKYQGDKTVSRMVNPTSDEVEALFGLKLVGFNNRKYDNHILYGRFMAYDNEALYKLSQKIIEGNIGAMFGEAYNLSYADIYEFSSKKQSLKKFQIELGLKHKELNLPWDQPVPDEMIPMVVEYCVNDVETTEAVLEARSADLTARMILAELSGLSVNDTTQKHTSRIIFGRERNHQKQFIYTDLATGKHV